MADLGPSTSSDWIKQCPSVEFVTSIGGQTTGAGDRVLTMEIDCGAQPGAQSDGNVDGDNPSPGRLPPAQLEQAPAACS